MYQFVIDKKSGQLRKGPLLVFATMILLIFITVLALDRKNTAELTKITQSSIKAQLIAVAQSASTLIDMDAYMEYTSLEAVQADRAAYQQMRRALSALGSSVGAKYIYVLREIDGVYYFIFDTDTEVDTTLLPYEISAVHEQAFAGAWTAGIMNVKDEYGSFNTGAVPIYYAGEIAGIVCVDYEDRFFSESIQTAKQNQIVLVTTLLLVLATLTLFLLQVLHRLAQSDALMGLPNRVYLFEYLEELSQKGPQEPFALLFTDLDNFKQVNDSAGHDAGDELLRKIAEFLQQQSSTFMENMKGKAVTFRPTAGLLNVSARVGGDEFIQVFPGAATAEDAARIAEYLLENFKTSEISGYVAHYQVTLSIGIALFPRHAEGHHVLIKYADTAMYHAKKTGKSQYCIYADGLLGKDEEMMLGLSEEAWN